MLNTSLRDPNGDHVTGTTHALAGMAAGKLCRDPWKAFLAGVVSHAAIKTTVLP